MTRDEIKLKIETDPVFINIKRFDYSIENLIDRYPDGAPLRLIAQALNMTEEEVQETYNNVLTKLKAKF